MAFIFNITFTGGSGMTFGNNIYDNYDVNINTENGIETYNNSAAPFQIFPLVSQTVPIIELIHSDNSVLKVYHLANSLTTTQELVVDDSNDTAQMFTQSDIISDTLLEMHIYTDDNSDPESYHIEMRNYDSGQYSFGGTNEEATQEAASSGATVVTSEAIDTENATVAATAASVQQQQSASTSADPYVNPINGPRYKLPIDNHSYRLFETSDLIVNAQQWVPSQKEADFMNAFMNTIHTPIGKDEQPFEYVNTGMSFFKDIYVQYKGRSDIINLVTQKAQSNTFVMEDGHNSSSALEEYEGEQRTTKVIRLGEVTLKMDLYSNLQILTGVTIDAPESVMQTATGGLVYSTNPKYLKVNKLCDGKATTQAKRDMIQNHAFIHREKRCIEVFNSNGMENSSLRMF